ncbi:MAG TPA: DUF1801 domain-containing protein [Candidatus Paceibacterota bacterium]
MAELKTKPTDASARDFIEGIEGEVRRKDGLVLLKMFARATGQKPRMWGESIVGFGMFHYKSARSSQEGDWPLVGFSPRKQNLTLYVMPYMSAGFPGLRDLLMKLGKHKTSGSCLYINKLSDVNPKALEQLIKKSYQHNKELHKSNLK